MSVKRFIPGCIVRRKRGRYPFLHHGITPICDSDLSFINPQEGFTFLFEDSGTDSVPFKGLGLVLAVLDDSSSEPIALVLASWNGSIGWTGVNNLCKVKRQ